MSVTSIDTLITPDMTAPILDRHHKSHATSHPPQISVADRLGLIILLGGLLFATFGFPLKGGPDR